MFKSFIIVIRKDNICINITLRPQREIKFRGLYVVLMFSLRVILILVTQFPFRHLKDTLGFINRAVNSNNNSLIKCIIFMF